MKLEELNLPIRTYNILKRANINDTDRLTQYSAQQITMIRNSRQSDAEAVIKALAKHGLALSPTGLPDFGVASEAVKAKKPYVETLSEPIRSALQSRGLSDLYDFANVTRSYVASVPGMTPVLLWEICDAMKAAGVRFATKHSPFSVLLADDSADCDAEAFRYNMDQLPAFLRTSLKEAGLVNKEDFNGISKNFLASLPGMTQSAFECLIDTLEDAEVELQP